MSAAAPPSAFVNPGLNLDLVAGPPLWATWLNLLFFGILICQVITYAPSWKSDQKVIKVLVVAIFTLDILSVFNACAIEYLYSVTHFGDYVYLTGQWTPFLVYTTSNGATTLLVQTFLVYRVLKISKNWIVCIILEAVVLLSLCGCLATTIALATSAKTLAGRKQVDTVVSLWMVASAVADVLIAGTLIYFLVRFKSSFSQTQSNIRRLIYSAIPTGSVTAFCAVAVFISYKGWPTSQLPTGLNLWLGRIYSLSFFLNINYRKTLSTNPASQGDSVGGGMSRWTKKGDAETENIRLQGLQQSGIQVQTLTHTHFDAEPEKKSFEYSREAFASPPSSGV